MSHDPVRRIVLAGAAILAACSSDSPTNPGGGNPQPGPLTGRWVAAVGVLSGSGASCRFPTLMFAMKETGTSLGGTFDSYGKGICIVGGSAYVGATPPGSMTGSVADSVIQITPSLPNFQMTGVVRGDSLIGTLTRTLTLTGGPIGSVSVTGTWRASRVPTDLPAGAGAFIQIQPDLLTISQADSLLPTITVRDSARQGIPVQPPVTLTVSDTTVATISTAGWIKGKARVTSYTVIARSGAAYSEAVGVVLPRAASFVITPQPVVIHRTHEAQLTVRVLDYAGTELTGAPVAYSSSVDSIVTVSASGHLIAPGPLGRAYIRVSSGGAIDSVPVSVVAVPVSMSLTPATALAPGDSLQLQVTAVDSVGLVIDTPTVAYASDLPAVIAVSAKGMVKAVAPAGFATITATLGSVVRTTRILSRSGSRPAIVATATLGGTPYGLAISSTGAMYVGDASGNGLFRGDLPAYDFPLQIPTGGVILGVAFDPAGTRAFVARDSLDRLLVIDVATNQVIDSIVTGAGEDPVAAAVTPDGQKLIVGTGSSVRVYDAHTFGLLGSIAGTGFTNHFSFHPSQAIVYASSDSVMEIDLTTVSVLRAFGFTGTTGRPQGTAVAPDGTELYVATESSAVIVYDLATGLAKYTAAGGGFGLAYSASQDLIYSTGGTVVVFDRLSMVPIANLFVGGIPRLVALDAAGTTAVVTDQSGWVDFIK
jgi:YVTN family beta-propeller protein